jgi:hypothetical protein
MHKREHLGLVGPGTLFDSVKTQRARRAAAALIERGNKTGMGFHPLKLLLVEIRSFHDDPLPFDSGESDCSLNYHV